MVKAVKTKNALKLIKINICLFLKILFNDLNKLKKYNVFFLFFLNVNISLISFMILSF